MDVGVVHGVQKILFRPPIVPMANAVVALHQLANGVMLASLDGTALYTGHEYAPVYEAYGTP